MDSPQAGVILLHHICIKGPAQLRMQLLHVYSAGSNCHMGRKWRASNDARDNSTSPELASVDTWTIHKNNSI